MLPLHEPAGVPLDNHPLASLIYNLVWLAAPDYAEFLHEEGLLAVDSPEQASAFSTKPQRGKKRFKLFTFSRLEQRGKRIANGRQWFRAAPIEWQIASPLDEMIELLVQGLLAQGVVSIGDQYGDAQFGVTETYVIEPPVPARQMRLRTISPIFVAVDDIKADGSRRKHHVRADDPRFAERVAANLLGKYRALTGTEPSEGEFTFNFVGEPKSQLVQYRGTNHHSYLGQFEVSGSAELIRLGWECGFGEANSKGFGMAE
jgi:CRISPR-associated endoribonuclease Cas6